MNFTRCIPGRALIPLLFIPMRFLVAESAAATLPDGLVTATLTSGRTLTAAVDPQTDRNTLWLRWGGKGMVIQQPVPWDRVAEVSVGERRMAAAEFIRSLTLDKSHAAPGPAAEREIVIGSWSRQREDGVALSLGVPSPQDAASSQQPARIQSLAIDAALSNWDNTAEVDGLMIEVSPLDAAGNLTPVRGTLEVELIGCESVNFRPDRLPPRLGRWVQQVEANDFTVRGARYPLAFQQIRPDADLSLSPQGTLRARLAVPGQGVFDATATVRIRQATAIRDRR